jgi:hypothetical protein
MLASCEQRRFMPCPWYGRIGIVTRIVHVPYVAEQDEDGVWCASAQLRLMAGRSSSRFTRAAISRRALCGTSWRSSAWTPRSSGSCSEPETHLWVQDPRAVSQWREFHQIAAATQERRAGRVSCHHICRAGRTDIWHALIPENRSGHVRICRDDEVRQIIVFLACELCRGHERPSRAVRQAAWTVASQSVREVDSDHGRWSSRCGSMPACGQLPPVRPGTVIISSLSGLGKVVICGRDR